MSSILDRLIKDFSTDPDQRKQQEDYNRRIQSIYDRSQDRQLATKQFDAQLAQRRQQHAATLRAQQLNQQRMLSFQRMQADRQSRFQQEQLGLQRQTAADEKKYRQQLLTFQRGQAADEKTYRDQLLKRDDQKFQFEQAERQRVREQTAAQFKQQFEQQKEQYDKTLAFNRERAEKEDKTRVQAQVLAEAGARKQVLSSLGYDTGVTKTKSPLENLLVQNQRGRQGRRRLSRV